MFSCEFCEISKNTFFTEHLRTTASKYLEDYVNLEEDIQSYSINKLIKLSSFWWEFYQSGYHYSNFIQKSLNLGPA